MFMVSTPNGFRFRCVELGDAISLGDSLAKDLEETVVVVDEDNQEVVYSAKP